MKIFSVESAREFLDKSGIFYEADDSDGPKWSQTINLNDTFYRACSDCEYVSDEELPRVAELLYRYGWCGICYWVVVEKRKEESVEFEDTNRFIKFVSIEESIRAKEPSYSKRAYLKWEYVLGDTRPRTLRCDHANLVQKPWWDYCPDCGYEIRRKPNSNAELLEACKLVAAFHNADAFDDTLYDAAINSVLAAIARHERSSNE